MSDYKRLYHMMFNKVTDVIGELQNLQQDVIVELQKLQQDVEEEYLNLTEDIEESCPRLKLIKNDKKPSR